MPTYNKPGVYFEESALATTQVSSGTAPSVAAFVGVTDRGPTTTGATKTAVPTLVTSWSEYLTLFGFGSTVDVFKSTVEPNSTDMKYAIKSFFENGGSQAYVTRLVNSDAVAATVNINGAGSVAAITVTAKDPGTWGDKLWAAAVTNADTNYFDLYVFYSETATSSGDITSSYNASHLEHFSQLNMTPGSSRYAPNVVSSSYITVSHPAANTSNINPTTGTLAAGTKYQLSGGTKGGTSPLTATVTASTVSTMLSVLDTINGPLIINWPKSNSEKIVTNAATYTATATTTTITTSTAHGFAVGDVFSIYDSSVASFDGTYVAKAGTTGSTLVFDRVGAVVGSATAISATLVRLNNYDANVVDGCLNYASGRADAFVVVDAKDDTVANVITAITNYAGDKNYGAAYFPPLYVPDPTSSIGAIKKIAPGGAVAALYASIDARRGPFQSPAGVGTKLNNVVSVQSLTNSEYASIAGNATALNVIRYVPGAGICVMGARTLSTSFESRYISVRRSLQYLNRTLTNSLQFAVFEPNDQLLWSRVQGVADTILNSFWRSGGLKGANASQAYFIKCDATTNTQSAIDTGELRIEIGVALQKPAEFVIIKIGQMAGGTTVTTSI